MVVRPPRSRRCTSLLLLAALLALPAPGGATGGPRGDAGRAFAMLLPPAPILAGDLVALHSARRLGRGWLRRLSFSVGAAPAEAVAIDPHTLLLVVPPGVSGAQRVLVVERRGRRERVLFEGPIELASIQVKTREPARQSAEFGLRFEDPVGLRPGSRVDGWARALGVATLGTTSPVGVTGSITGRAGAVISLLLTGDAAPQAPATGAATAQSLAVPITTTTLSVTVNFGTGVSFGTISTGGTRIGFVGDVSISIPPPAAVVTPEVASVSPNPAPPGSIVTLSGAALGALQDRSRVVLGGHPVVTFPRVRSWSDDTVRVQLPRALGGIFDLYVLRDLVPAVPVPIEIEPPCPPVPPFTQLLGGSGQDVAFAVRQTRDCGYVLAGRTTSAPALGVDALLIRTDAHGQPLWSRTYGGKGLDEAKDVVETHHGFVFAGQTQSSDLGASGSDFYVVATDGDGNVEWSRVLGFATTERAEAVELLHEHDHGAEVALVVGGFTTQDQARRGTDALFYVLDVQGGVVATRIAGGRGDDRVDDLVATSSEGFLGVGRTRSPEFGTSGFDPYAVLLDLDGSVRWEGAFGGAPGDEHAQSVEATGQGTYLLAGQGGTALDAFVSAGAGGDVLLVELDEAGNPVRRAQLPANGQDVATAGAFPTGDGGFAVTGFTTSSSLGASGTDAFVARVDCGLALGAVEVFGSPANVERAHGAAVLSDAGTVLAGEFVHTSRTTGRTDTDVLLVKTAPLPGDAPVIDDFTANSLPALQVRTGDPVTLHWRVRDADEIAVERLGGNGPPLDLVDAGGPLVDASFTFPAFGIGSTACGDTCGDAVYRLAARNACAEVQRNVVVTVVPLGAATLSPEEERLLEMESNLVQRFDQPMGGVGSLAVSVPDQACVGDSCTPIVRVLPTAHPDVVTDPSAPVAVCITGSGVPYTNASVEVGVDLFGEDIDDGAPPILSYRPDGTLASMSFGEILFQRGDTTPPTGLPLPDSAWFGHYSGWHTADGGMTIWGIDDFVAHPGLGIPLVPPLVCFGPPEFGSPLRGPGCGAVPVPLVPHPGAWDVHLFRELAFGGVMRPGFVSFDAGVADPCAGATRLGSVCESGSSPLSAAGGRASLFPAVDLATGTFVPTPCGP
jgi:hypothetical protein